MQINLNFKDPANKAGALTVFLTSLALLLASFVHFDDHDSTTLVGVWLIVISAMLLLGGIICGAQAISLWIGGSED